MASKAYSRVALSIAGSDPSAGAGIQADLKTFAAMGVYGCAVITALTAQSSRGVSGVWGLSAGAVAQQIAAITADIPVNAIKTGMLYNAAVMVEVASELDKVPDVPLVLDPVICASSGALLLLTEDIPVLIDLLFPRATVLTPNLDEAAQLLSVDRARDIDDMQRQAEKLLALGPKAVLMKGGHLPGDEIVDVLAWREGNGLKFEHFTSSRVDTPNTHGTGCALSSAIAANLALGLALVPAVAAAKEFVWRALDAGRELNIGGGIGPLHHCYQFVEHFE